MIKDDDQNSATSKQIVVVLGWADELNRLSKAQSAFRVSTAAAVVALDSLKGRAVGISRQVSDQPPSR